MSCSLGRCFPLCCAVFGLFCRGLFAQPSSVSDFSFPVTDGPVYVALETNGILYVGGPFTTIGPRNGAFVPVSPDTGALAGPGAYFGGSVAPTLLLLNRRFSWPARPQDRDPH